MAVRLKFGTGSGLSQRMLVIEMIAMSKVRAFIEVGIDIVASVLIFLKS